MSKDALLFLLKYNEKLYNIARDKMKFKHYKKGEYIMSFKAKIQESKKKAEQAIFEAIRDFEEETGFKILHIADVRPNSVLSQSPPLTIRVTIDGII